MDAAEVISQNIYQELFVSYLNKHINDLETINPNDINNSMAPLFELYQNSGDEFKCAIKEHIEFIIADVASTILGGFDGATSVGN